MFCRTKTSEVVKMTPETWEELNQKYKVITYSQESKKMDTNPIRGWLVQGENQTTAVAIVGPPKIKSISLQNLRMAIRISSEQYETTVEKTLDETQLIDEETYMMLWIVGKEETAVPGNISVSLIGYGGDEEVIKISSDGITIKADDLEGQAPPESTWQQILSEVQAFATQAAQSKDAAEQAEQTAIEKASEALASAGTAAQKAAEAIAAASTAAADAAALAAAQTEEEIKGFADDRYARALIVTEEPAESLTIYPDAGSNIVVTSHGYTEQSGSGDASPVNIRPIKVGGMKLVEVDFDGDPQISVATKSSWVNYALFLVATDVDSSRTGFCSDQKDLKKTSAELLTFEGVCLHTNNAAYISVSMTGAGISKSDGDEQAVQKAKAYLKGKHRVLWYKPSDETKATGLYTQQIVDGESYHCECIELHQPFCQDDTVISSELSGCDKSVVFDGSDDELWTVTSNGFSIKNPFPNAIPAVSNQVNKHFYCNRLHQKAQTGSTIPVETFCVNQYAGNNFVWVNTDDSSELEAFKSGLSQNPLIFYYRSTEYTAKNDEKACIERHVRYKHTLTSADDWKSGGGSGTDQYYCALPFNAQTGNEICTQYKRSTSAGTVNSFQCTGTGVYVRTATGTFASVEEWKAHLDSEKAAGKPVEVEYQLATPITYAQPAIRTEADPKTTDGSVKITGEKTVSATHNKSLKKAFEELKAVVLAFGAGLKE